jgi:Cof subfamily protein (haloacid dehalogenase superfamily)
MTSEPLPRGKISLVVSDVDGTLVTTDKRLTDATRAAVRRLGESGIAFTIVSSRPPFGLRMLVEPLGLTRPFGAYNGGALVGPGLDLIEQHLIPPAAARRAVDFLQAKGVDVWLFSGSAWLVRNPEGAYVDHEVRTIHTPPTVVERFDDHLGTAAKIVGVSADFDRLAACEPALKAALGDAASVSRSQRYYLDVTPPGVDKGTFVDALSRRLGIPPDEIVTIGDMENDVAMFRRSGVSIAMGNASPEVQRLASAVTLSNDEDGFAAAVERLILKGSTS